MKERVSIYSRGERLQWSVSELGSRVAAASVVTIFI